MSARLRNPALLVFFLVFVAAALTLPEVGVTDDDDFYLPAGHSYFRWSRRVVSEPSAALRQDQLDAHWSPNREHPPLAKWFIGLGRYLGHELSGWMPALDAGRLGTCFFFALVVALIFALARERLGLGPAIFAAAAFVLIPRLAFHGRVATLDMPVAAMSTLFFFAFWRLHRTRSAKAILLMTLAFGLALSTKLNAPFTLLACGVFWLLESLPEFRRNREGIQLPDLPLWLLIIPVGGLLIQVALWPWLWPDVIGRFSEYVRFHTGHYPIYLFYEGQIWERPFAPWHAPFAHTWAVLPTSLLFAALVGFAVLLRQAFGFERFDERPGPDEGMFARYLLIHGFIAIGTVAFSPVPKYGGIKLFLPFFPLLAIAMGFGMKRLLECLPKKPWAVPVLAGLLLSGGAIDSWKFRGQALSSFGAHVGGLSGAVQRGYERQYYDVFDRHMARWLSENTPKSGRVYFEPNHKEYVRSGPYLKRTGDLRSDIRLRGGHRADIVVLTHERRWRTFADLAEKLKHRPVLYEHRVDGVVLWTAFGRD